MPNQKYWRSGSPLTNSRSPLWDEVVTDEYKRLWATGSMKDPSIIPFNLELRMKDRQ